MSFLRKILMMKKLLIPLFVMAVILLGYYVYQDAEIKKKQLNQTIHESSYLTIHSQTFKLKSS